MDHLIDTITADPSAGEQPHEGKRRRLTAPDRRREERLNTLRPVFFIRRGIDGFHQGAILNCSPLGICLHTALPVEPRTSVYLTTHLEETASFYYKTGESGIARAVWCEMREGAYRIGLMFQGGPQRMAPLGFENNTIYRQEG